MYRIKNYLQDIDYHLDEHVFKTVPGLILQDAYLAIRIDRIEGGGGEWYIESVYMVDEKNNIISYDRDHWLCATLIKEIDADPVTCRHIYAECNMDD